MKIENIGKFFTLFLVAFLPWSVIFSVLGTERLWLNIARFSKEILVIIIVILYVIDVIKRKIKIWFDLFDGLTLAFIGILLWVSFFQGTSLKWIVYWLRYDVGFLVLMMIMRRVLPLWNITLRDILKVFLISGWWMLVMWFLIRYVFGESILTLVWFSDKVSVWGAGWPPPIFHGIAGAAVIRFQGMLEGPNQMAFFLLLYIGAYMTVFAQKRRYFFMNMLVVLFLLFLLMQTYSRSWYLGAILWMMYVFGYSFISILKKGNILKRYKITLRKIITFFIAVTCIALVFMLQFGNKIAPIFERHGSTSWHFERMYIGWLRFIEHPMGHWLAQAGPASRAVFEVNQNPVADSDITDTTISHVVTKLHKRNPDFIFNTETYYIPESWYIQLMIEGGILGVFLFGITILCILFWLRNNKYLLGATLGILLMNLVLHSFESVHTAFMWSIIVASIIEKSSKWESIKELQ